jgi:hypothetical protein
MPSYFVLWACAETPTRSRRSALQSLEDRPPHPIFIQPRNLQNIHQCAASAALISPGQRSLVSGRPGCHPTQGTECCVCLERSIGDGDAIYSMYATVPDGDHAVRLGSIRQMPEDWDDRCAAVIWGLLSNLKIPRPGPSSTARVHPRLQPRAWQNLGTTTTYHHLHRQVPQ